MFGEEIKLDVVARRWVSELSEKQKYPYHFLWVIYIYLMCIFLVFFYKGEQR